MLDIGVMRELKRLDRRLQRAEAKPPGNGTVNPTECCCEPLTNGDADNPELIFADGDVIMVCGDISPSVASVLLLETGTNNALTQENDDWILLE